MIYLSLLLLIDIWVAYRFWLLRMLLLWILLRVYPCHLIHTFLSGLCPGEKSWSMCVFGPWYLWALTGALYVKLLRAKQQLTGFHAEGVWILIAVLGSVRSPAQVGWGPSPVAQFARQELKPSVKLLCRQPVPGGYTQRWCSEECVNVWGALCFPKGYLYR